MSWIHIGESVTHYVFEILSNLGHIIRLYQGYIKGVSRVYQGYIRCMSRVYQGSMLESQCETFLRFVSVFRVCSILKSFHHLAHLVCQFLAFFNMRHLERFNDLLTLLTITDQLRQIEAFYLAFFWSLHIFCLTFFLF